MTSQLTPEKISSARVLVVGDTMLDRYWYGAVDRISPEAPVPVVRVTHTEERIGAAANVAYNIVTLGAQASLLSVVGDDEDSRILESLVAQTGITPHFGRDAQLKTTVKLRVIGRQQQLLRLDFENTPENEVCWPRSPPLSKNYTCSMMPCCSPITAKVAWRTSC
jgi:rfaE bifunctional protein kinase chain/domain